MRNHRSLALLSAVLGMSLVLAGCGDGGPSVRAEPVTTTSEPTTTSSTDASTTTTTTPPVPVPDGLQLVRFQGVQLLVPADWPVHDLLLDPNTCIRLDQHAAYLGEPGESPICPAHAVGRTETVWIAPLSDRLQVDAARATEPTTINRLTGRMDPRPNLNGALTVVIDRPALLVVITFGADRALADAVLASLQATPS